MMVFFRHNKRVEHCRIKTNPHGPKQYRLVRNQQFENIYALVEHYKTKPLQAENLNQILTKAAPQPEGHSHQK